MKQPRVNPDCGYTSDSALDVLAVQTTELSRVDSRVGLARECDGGSHNRTSHRGIINPLYPSRERETILVYIVEL